MRNKFLLRLARISVFTAAALVMHYLESLLPPLLAFAPGSKMGLSNIITLSAIIFLGYIDAFTILVIRCVLGSLFGNVFGLVYSLGGGVCAFIVMSLMYKFLCPKISIVGISVSGAVVHNIIQTLIAAAIVRQINLVIILPAMLIASIIAGVFVGFVVYFLVKYLPLSLFIDNSGVTKEQINKIFEEKKS
ncbi:MAG TPA: Gx transporter family protein [Clostridia bacterium]